MIEFLTYAKVCEALNQLRNVLLNDEIPFVDY